MEFINNFFVLNEKELALALHFGWDKPLGEPMPMDLPPFSEKHREQERFLDATRFYRENLDYHLFAEVTI